MATENLVLVSGATGFLGAHCIKRLLDQGYRVRGTVRSLNNAKKVAPVRKLDPTGTRLTLVEADLNQAAGWETAVAGCDYVLHVASPFPIGGTEETIHTAIAGTKNVLVACANEPSVKKVVLTSSLLAICEGHPSGRLTDQHWSILDHANAYTKSKTLAEQSAWKFVKKGGHTNNFILTVVNPGFITGPPLTDEKGTSADVISRIMGNLPALPQIIFSSIDVRDVAAAHVAALTAPETDGQRVICTNAEPVAMVEFSKALRKEFKTQGYCPPTHTIPDWIVKLGGIFSAEMADVASRLGKAHSFDNSRLKSLLGGEPIAPSKSVVDMVYELIERGHIKKTSKYRGPSKKER
ncbi:unnamed protein product, partial [Mesorhabditis spiculigera]